MGTTDFSDGRARVYAVIPMAQPHCSVLKSHIRSITRICDKVSTKNANPARKLPIPHGGAGLNSEPAVD